MSLLTNQLKIQGFLSVLARDVRTGEIVYRVDKPNLICKGSRIAMAKLAAQRTIDEAGNERVWAIYVGDDGTVPSSNQEALLGSNITRKTVTQDVTIVPPEDSGIIEVEATFGTSDHNNRYIREVGLFTRGTDADPDATTDARMLARQTHGEIYKTSAIQITYTWRYQFTT